MKPGKLMLEYAGKVIIPKIWNDVRDSVSVAEKTGFMTGEEKKAFAINRMKELGYELSKGLLDFAIQLAWLWLQAYLGREVIAIKDKKAL